MPKIEVARRDLERLCPSLPGDDAVLEELLASLKGELKTGGELLKIELNDTNRPDLWCAEGVARGISALNGSSRRYLVDLPEPSVRIEVDDSVTAVRPWIAAFKASGPPIDEEALDALVAAQEKLAGSFGRNRKTAAIGFYRSGCISFPVRYSAVPRDSVRFTPLGCDSEMTLSGVLSETETGRKYAHLVEEGAPCPLISDSSGSVLSFPPVINSEGTGRVSTGDRDLFCEVTGTDWNTVGLTASILACNLEDRGFRIEPVEIRYPRETPDGRSVSITPHRFCDTLSTTRERISTVLGILPDDAAIERSLIRMGWDSWTIDGAVVEARMPPYRHDGMHEVDLIEDIAVGYGLNRFEPLMPEGYTIGASAAIEDLADAVRIMLAGAGCEEVLLPILTSEGRPGTPPGIVRIENPMTLEYGAVRNSLIPGLLGVEAVSSHTPYPHRVFEVGEVLENGSGDLRTVVRLAVSISGNDAGFGDVHSVIGLICHGRGHSLALTPSGDDRFIPGRSCTLMVDGREAGVMGEVHPSILDELGITRPVAAFELDLESLGGAVQG